VEIYAESSLFRKLAAGVSRLIATDDNSVKGRNTQRDPRVAISLVDLDDPYSVARIRGRDIERRRDSDFKYIYAVSKKYVGKPRPTVKTFLSR
jgi:hypothetical protein